jgi:4-amino-4-deoxy-L-arabinose transferase-like glycosyltransferase
MTISSRSAIYGISSFVLITLLFVAYKWESLLLAHFWDESWVYVPAIKQLAGRGAGLLPSALDPELSRGHPLFFHFMGASWISIFGESALSLHAFALSLSAGVAFLVYHITSALTGNVWAGICAAVLLYVQGMFVAQSAMVLPEMLIALLVLLSLWLFIRQRYVLLCIVLCLGVLTKESFILVYALLVGMQVLLWLYDRKDAGLRSIVTGGVVFVLPALVLAGFFYIQYRTYGWYLYPTHIGMIKFDPWMMAYDLHNGLIFLVNDQGRLMLFLSSLCCALWLIWKRSYRLLWLLFVPLVVFIVLLLMMEKYNATAELFLLGTCCVIVWFIFTLKHWKEGSDLLKFTLMSCGFVFVYLAFCMINFFSLRYTLCLLPLLLIFAVSGMVAALPAVRVRMVYMFVMLSCVYTVFCNSRVTQISDVELSFLPALRVQHRMVKYLEDNHYYKKAVFVPFLDINNLKQPLSGFRSNDSIFEQVHSTYKPGKVDLLIFHNIEPDPKKDSILASGHFRLVKVFEEKMVKLEIYRDLNTERP